MATLAADLGVIWTPVSGRRMTLGDIKTVTVLLLSAGATVTSAALVVWARRIRAGSNVSNIELFLIGCWMILPFAVLLTAYLVWPDEPGGRRTLSIVSTLVAALSVLGYSYAAMWNAQHRSLLAGGEVLVLPLYQMGAITIGAVVMCAQRLRHGRPR